jgi:hypothetical protein
MKLLQWFVGVAILGISMIVVGSLGMANSRDGLAIGGSVVFGSAVIGVAILAAAKK